MLKLLLKYKIAKIIPMQESFFCTSILPKNIKLSSELIKLNYEKLSPFKNPYIITYRDEKQLYLWFVEKITEESLFILPEAFLLYKILKDQSDGIYLFDTKPNKICILKKRKLVASFISPQSDEYSVALLKNEYNLSDVFNYSTEVFEENKMAAIKKISLKELHQFIQFSFSREDVQNFFVEKLTYPIISLLLVYMCVSYLQSHFMQNRVKILTEQYHILKRQNRVVKIAIQKHNKEVEKYQNFVKSELSFVDPYHLLYDMYKIITPHDKATIKFLEITENTVRLMINTKENPIKYLNRLNKIKYFKNVVIQNTYENQRTGRKTINYTIELMSVK